MSVFFSKLFFVIIFLANLDRGFALGERVSSPPLQTKEKAKEKAVKFPLKDGIYRLSPLNINVEVTPKAQKQLKAMGEVVKVALFIAYNKQDQIERPLTPQEKVVAITTMAREFYLPETGGTLSMGEWKIPERSGEPLEPTLLIQGGSSFRTCTLNLLDCSAYQENYPTNEEQEKQPIKIKCDIINDPPKCKV